MQHFMLGIVMLFSPMIIGQSIDSSKVIEGQKIEASVNNALNNNGKILFALYDESNFLKAPIMAKSSTINDGKSTVVFENVPSGNYAIVCYHDENENNQMDFFENGMPKESYGSSNNPLNYGPPQFEASKFELTDKDITLEIKF